jgi:hypothetical protein
VEVDEMANYIAVKLPTKEWDHIVKLGTESHIKEIEDQLREANQKCIEFEQRYGMTLEHLRRIGLPDNASMEMHADYVEWNSWEGYRVELQTKLESLRAILEGANAG